MRTAVLTGGSGFIGGWLVRELLDCHYEVAVVARSGLKLSRFIKDNCKVIERSLQELTPGDLFPADVFFHLAWEGVSSERKNDMDVQLTNIRYGLQALEAAHEAGCGLFLAAGTVAEYALCDHVIDLRDRQRPNDMYGAAKTSARYFLEVRARQLGQPFIWSVLPSTFGEGRTDHNIVTDTIRALQKGERPVYGSLTQMWDFLYVRDVARAIRLVSEKGIPGKVYGIGSGQYRTLYDYITRIRDVVAPGLPLGIGENKGQSNRTLSSCVNNYDLIKDTGFQPEYTFEEAIRRTVQYFKEKAE